MGLDHRAFYAGAIAGFIAMAQFSLGLYSAPVAAVVGYAVNLVLDHDPQLFGVLLKASELNAGGDPYLASQKFRLIYAPSTENAEDEFF